MERHILSIDAGTTGVTVSAIDRRGRVLRSADRDFRQRYPRPGWVEHDAEEIWRITRRLVLKHRDGATAVVTLATLKDGARVRVEYSRPPGDEDAVALRSAERAWHAALLSLQSRLESRGP